MPENKGRFALRQGFIDNNSYLHEMGVQAAAVDARRMRMIPSTWRIPPRYVAVVLLPAAAGLAGFLALEQRDLERRYEELLQRALHAHAGMFVPAFETHTVRTAEPLAVGDPPAGRPDILYFFTTTCPHSRASLPAFQQIAARAGPHGRVVGIALDTASAARSYAEEHGLEYPVVSLLDRRLVSLYRVRRVPLVMVVDAGGRVLYARQGALESAAAVDSVLAVASGAAAEPVTASPVPAARTHVVSTRASTLGGEP